MAGELERFSCDFIAIYDIIKTGLTFTYKFFKNVLIKLLEMYRY